MGMHAPDKVQVRIPVQAVVRGGVVGQLRQKPFNVLWVCECVKSTCIQGKRVKSQRAALCGTRVRGVKFVAGCAMPLHIPENTDSLTVLEGNLVRLYLGGVSCP